MTLPRLNEHNDRYLRDIARWEVGARGALPTKEIHVSRTLILDGLVEEHSCKLKLKGLEYLLLDIEGAEEALEELRGALKNAQEKRAALEEYLAEVQRSVFNTVNVVGDLRFKETRDEPMQAATAVVAVVGGLVERTREATEAFQAVDEKRARVDALLRAMLEAE